MFCIDAILWTEDDSRRRSLWILFSAINLTDSSWRNSFWIVLSSQLIYFTDIGVESNPQFYEIVDEGESREYLLCWKF